jgi:hypothetical protein
MVIQSHPQVGGKCLDVPYAQFLVGMRVQMWDYNNSNAQIFVYDEQSQQLRIGDKCVEVWGRGDPQDAIDISACNGGVNQHWRMVASKNYYQIIAINNRCIELRYGLNYDGAALDIQDCDAGRPWRLWALADANGRQIIQIFISLLRHQTPRPARRTASPLATEALKSFPFYCADR